MTLTLTLRAPPPSRLDLSALIPEYLASLDQRGIETLTIPCGKQRIPVGDLFQVAMGEASAVAIEGVTPRCDLIGAGISRGTMIVSGEAGVQLGRRASGGRIEMRGDAGAFAASGMTGGVLVITGNAGDFLGGPLAGETSGMAGGTVLVRGNAGERVADKLRRGTVIIEGNVEADAASRLIAGTLIVCGNAGPRPGMMMRRGTLVLASAALLPSFAAAGPPAPVFAALLSRSLRGVSEKAAALVSSATSRYIGDMATLGKGEILLAT